MPATSPADSSSTVTLKPLRSAYFKYCRMSMLAQSQASVPPAPACMSTNALHESASLLNMRLNSSCSTMADNFLPSTSMVSKPASSPSSLLISNNSLLSESSEVRVLSVTTTPSRAFFSLPNSWAFLGSFQTVGSSSDALTVLRRSDLAS